MMTVAEPSELCKVSRRSFLHAPLSAHVSSGRSVIRAHFRFPCVFHDALHFYLVVYLEPCKKNLTGFVSSGSSNGVEYA